MSTLKVNLKTMNFVVIQLNFENIKTKELVNKIFTT